MQERLCADLVSAPVLPSLASAAARSPLHGQAEPLCPVRPLPTHNTPPLVALPSGPAWSAAGVYLCVGQLVGVLHALQESPHPLLPRPGTRTLHACVPAWCPTLDRLHGRCGRGCRCASPPALAPGRSYLVPRSGRTPG